MGRAKSLGSLSTTITAPEAPVRKARQPKVVQRGVELAFRRRQNAKFREGKAAVIAVLNPDPNPNPNPNPITLTLTLTL